MSREVRRIILTGFSWYYLMNSFLLHANSVFRAMYHRHAVVAYVTGASWVFVSSFVERARGTPLAYAHVLESSLLTLHNWRLLRRLAVLVIKAIA